MVKNTLLVLRKTLLVKFGNKYMGIAFSIFTGILGLAIIGTFIFFMIKRNFIRHNFECPANEWTTIISCFATRGLPRTWEVYYNSENQDIKIEYKEKSFTWIFPNKLKTGILKSPQKFHNSWLSPFYTLKINPNHPIIININRI